MDFFNGIHYEPNIVSDTFNFDIGLICRKVFSGLVVEIIDKGLTNVAAVLAYLLTITWEILTWWISSFLCYLCCCELNYTRKEGVDVFYIRETLKTLINQLNKLYWANQLQGDHFQYLRRQAPTRTEPGRRNRA